MSISRIAAGLIFVALLWLGWNYVSPTDSMATHGNSAISKQTSGIDPFAVKKGVDRSMRSLLATLENIHDLPTAQHAAPILNTIADDLTRYASSLRALPAIDAQQIKDYIKEFIPHLSTPIEKIKAIDGIIAVLDRPLKKLEEALGLYRRR